MKILLRSLAVGAVLLSLAAHADTYPSKPITFIVPFGPGSGTDTITRVVAQHLGAALKQSVGELRDEIESLKAAISRLNFDA